MKIAQLKFMYSEYLKFLNNDYKILEKHNTKLADEKKGEYIKAIEDHIDSISKQDIIMYIIEDDIENNDSAAL